MPTIQQYCYFETIHNQGLIRRRCPSITTLLGLLLLIMVMNVGCEDSEAHLDTSAGESSTVIGDRDTTSQDFMGDEQGSFTDAGQPEALDGAPPPADDASRTEQTGSDADPMPDAEPMTDADPLSDYNGPRNKGIAMKSKRLIIS